MEPWVSWLVLKELRGLRECVCAFVQMMAGFPTGIYVLQIIGGKKMPITGVPAGSSGTFEVDPIPPTVPFPAGSVDNWSVDDPTVTLTPSLNNPAQVIANVPPDFNLPGAFNVSVSVQLPGTPAPAPLAATVKVPVLPPTAPTGVSINQVA